MYSRQLLQHYSLHVYTRLGLTDPLRSRIRTIILLLRCVQNRRVLLPLYHAHARWYCIRRVGNSRIPSDGPHHRYDVEMTAHVSADVSCTIRFKRARARSFYIIIIILYESARPCIHTDACTHNKTCVCVRLVHVYIKACYASTRADIIKAHLIRVN